ncbi:MAG: AAA family ATPase [Acaryochloris sp. RU_4_1]|nr:AAA family ATPase [Acaryochloris sp. SU_5_25]NJM65220.1 AAA family ATPase [Acaryochloris sp. RU_4_1]NJR55602.1 AAA family ATPase [Acaryochloris sp. CRU_2_0]
MQETWQGTLKHQLVTQYVQKSQGWVDMNISTSGLLNLTIVSDIFLALPIPQRKEGVLNVLHQLPVTVSPGFLSLYTPQEAESLNLSQPQAINGDSVYTWQDLALQAANPQNQSQLTQREPRVPRTVTFYSFKGGVGRTTALTHVAWILALRGRKIVAVDLDLEAPGLSTAFNLNPHPKYGIVDYFYERSYSPDGIEPTISVTQIFGEVRIPNATGRLFVVPAGSLDLDYISKVDDLRATTVTDSGENLWSIFSREIQEQLKPDILLIDSRTGINQWGALSLLQAADEVIVFLFPNEQNRQGISLLLQSLQSFRDLSINFVFTPVPDTTEVGMAKVKGIWKFLYEAIRNGVSEDDETIEGSSKESASDLDDSFAEVDPLVVPYLPTIALADSYPVPALLDYYTRIANLIDEETDELQRKTILTRPNSRWSIIESLQFPEVNAADPQQDLSLLFQRTTDFEKFLDDTNCLIRGRKGTGKTALYWLLLKHKTVAQQLAHGRLDNTTCLSGHGRFHKSRPSRDEFQVIHKDLQENNGTWEAFWRAYLLFRVIKENQFNFPKGNKGKKFDNVKRIINNLSGERWQYEHTQSLLQLVSDSNLLLIVKDALDIFDEQVQTKSQKIWILYDDLDEDFPEKNEVRQQALIGLLQLIQACDARRITSIRFKIFLREDIWNRLSFDNKSHFNGRDLLLQWNRVDFLRLALRQTTQSKEFKDLVDRFSPVESIDQASEEAVDRALELLWGSRRRSGTKAKYVTRWVYERLTDSSNTTFPRSLSILLRGAKEQELTYQGQSSKQIPTDRLLRGTSLEIGLKKASEERCQAVREEYPDLSQFFDSLKGMQALLSKEELQTIWQESAQNVSAAFDEFSDLLSEIGIAEWREKEQRYKFADIYVYGFEMSRRGTV